MGVGQFPKVSQSLMMIDGKANLIGRCCTDKTQGCQSCRGTPFQILKYQIQIFKYLDIHTNQLHMIFNTNIKYLNIKFKYLNLYAYHKPL